jgi:hypothetical protein
MHQNIGLQNRVFAELWISFVALIRSYAAAHDLGRPAGDRVLVDEGETGHLTARGGQRKLGLEFDGATGAGTWTVYENDPAADRVLERGDFRIDEDSQVRLSDRAGKLELEVAAEAFTAKVFD